jgi:arabinofuranosyltransferase
VGLETIDATVAGEQKSPRISRSRVVQLVLLLVPLVVLVVGAWHYRWMSDDGFINLRVVRQIQAGNGPVFNAGERVEATTSPLWVAALTLADLLLPIGLEWIGVVLGIAATACGAALLLWASKRLQPGAGIVVPTGIWILVAVAPAWKFASSGLENGLFVLWFGASFALLGRWAATSHDLPPLATGIVVGLGPLIRPDLALMSGCFLVAVVLVSRDRWQPSLRFVAVALALPFAYQIFRMGYYDSLVPNTALAKEASRAWWSQGWKYLRESSRPYWLWLPLVAVVVGGYVPMLRAYLSTQDRRRMAIVLACAAGGIAHLVYVARVGGDFMHARMGLPGLTALVAPVAVTRFDRKLAALVMPAIVCAWAAVAIISLRSTADRPISFVGEPNAVTLEDHGWQEGGNARSWFADHDVYFGTTPVDAELRDDVPSPAVASFGVGIGSYALGPDVYVLDMLGLGDAFTSHLELRRRGLIAHEKPLPTPWVAARLVAPTDVVDANDFPIPEWFLPRPLDTPVDPFTDRVQAAREALACGQLRALMHRVTGDLTPRRFVGNLWHSFADTRLRIPPEPSDAVRTFCDASDST